MHSPSYYLTENECLIVLSIHMRAARRFFYMRIFFLRGMVLKTNTLFFLGNQQQQRDPWRLPHGRLDAGGRHTPSLRDSFGDGGKLLSQESSI